MHNIKKYKTGLVIAMPLEAEPFVAGLEMEQIEHRPFPVYSCGDTVLIVSGIGRVRAGAAAAYLITRYDPGIIINSGTAGSNIESIAPGSIFEIQKVFDGDLALYRGPDYQEHEMEWTGIAERASLLTSDRPSITSEERLKASAIAELSDMEGASFAQICNLFVRKGYIFKIVSDAPGADDFSSIREGIIRYSGDMFNFFKENISKRISNAVQKKGTTVGEL